MHLNTNILGNNFSDAIGPVVMDPWKEIKAIMGHFEGDTGSVHALGLTLEY